MTDQYVPLMTFSSETGEVTIHEQGSKIVAAQRASTTTDAPVSGADPSSGLNALDRRLEYLEAQQKPIHMDREGKPVYPVSAEQRAKFAAEAAHLRTVVRPFEVQQAEALAARQAAAEAERAARLQSEVDQRDAVEARAYEIALEAQAAERAKQIAKELRMPYPVK